MSVFQTSGGSPAGAVRDPLTTKYSLSKDAAMGTEANVTLTAFAEAEGAVGAVNQGYAGSAESLTPPAAAEPAERPRPPRTSRSPAGSTPTAAAATSQLHLVNGGLPRTPAPDHPSGPGRPGSGGRSPGATPWSPGGSGGAGYWKGYAYDEDEDDDPDCQGSCSARARRACTRKMLVRRVPVVGWLPHYSGRAAVADLVAGVTVGLTVIPQAIAYANVAGLPPQYGLYSSFMACFVYAVFGSCKDSPVGPTAIAAILTRENLHDLPPELAVFLCFLSGCVELVMGVLQLGFLIDFISGPVSVGFTSAAAIIIATTQIKDILGLSFPGSKFLQVWRNLFVHIHETRLWDALLGLACMAVLLILRKVKDIPVGPSDSKEQSGLQRAAAQFLWLVSTARNILVVVACGVAAALLDHHGMQPFVLTGHVKAGLPELRPPPFSLQAGNQTLGFFEMASGLGSAVLVVPLLSILENISLAKVFSDGTPIDATQEMLALGLCNIASSFVSSMPVSGALSRGAVNNASGVATTFGGIYTGVLVILSLHLFTPYFFYIPKASLAAVIIAAVVFMVEFHVVKPIWRTKKADLIPACATFVSCLFLRLELGIVIGIGINVLFLLYASARPTVCVQRVMSNVGIEYLLVTPDRSLVFPSVEYVRNMVSKVGMKQGSSSVPVVIDARHIYGADFTAAKGVKSLIEDFVKRKQPLLFYNLKPSVVEVFQGVRPDDLHYCRTEGELNELLRSACSSRARERV